MKPYMSPCINSSDENFDPTLWSHLEDTNEYRKESEEDRVQHKENKSSGKMSQNTMKPYMSPCISPQMRTLIKLYGLIWRFTKERVFNSRKKGSPNEKPQDIHAYRFLNTNHSSDDDSECVENNS